ncbi:hypothetical protein D7V77_15365 [Corallococcus sp. CA041A]|nr:hypothetical protein D7V77_15365 [Corallococcus sp. CA041A]
MRACDGARWGSWWGCSRARARRIRSRCPCPRWRAPRPRPRPRCSRCWRKMRRAIPFLASRSGSGRPWRIIPR